MAKEKERDILVSMCNQTDNKKSGLLRINMSTSEIGWIDTGILSGLPKWFGKGGISGCTGIVSDRSYIYVLTRYQGNILVVLDKETYKPVASHRLEHVQAAHSVVANDDMLYIVSTGTDKVVRYKTEGSAINYDGIEWSASNEDTDTHHLNSILIHDGDLIVSGFGKKDGKLWKDAQNGYIYNITRGEYIVRGIHHPHTVCANGEQLFYCNSRQKAFYSLDGSAKIRGEGYVRGACFFDADKVAIGTSMGRKVSQSTGVTIENPIGPGELTGECCITIYNLKTCEKTKKFELSGFSTEIYDLCLI